MSGEDWQVYLGSKESAQYSTLTQINNGKVRMPAFKQLNIDVKEPIIDYLLSAENLEDIQNQEANSNNKSAPYKTTGRNRFPEREGVSGGKTSLGNTKRHQSQQRNY